MAPKRSRNTVSSSSSQNYIRLLDDDKEEHYETIRQKGVVLERSIDFPSITAYPRMIDVCNISWVEEFYANSFGHEADDYTSYVRGIEISYAPDEIDTIFGFRPEEHCSVVQRR
ncbi:hypothetical protein A2U01_0061408, partial [Trifolium medium]|nr:hypothetical protein [Trifolium medium]